MTIVHIGRVANKAHHSAPVVIGDFELMKQWRGDIDGEAEGQMQLGDGEIFGFTAFELGAPTVFVQDGVVSLLTPQGMTSGKPVVPDEVLLSQLLNGEPDKIEEEGNLSITSGGIVIALAYNATPEEGASTELLGECYSPSSPRLPCNLPSSNVYDEELVILPVTPGNYKVVWGFIGEYERCQIFLS